MSASSSSVARPRRATRSPRRSRVLVGCAGWAISRGEAGLFPPGPSHLARYAAVFDAVEINSSFYRPHRRATYERWAASVSPGFRFSVKMPREVTHDACLDDARALDAFLEQVGGLGNKLGAILVQLAPSLALDARTARRFFKCVRERWEGAVVCEPRHESWFSARAETLLCETGVARVAADPARVPAAGGPSGCPGVVYYRLHGSPRTYWSAYTRDYLDALATTLRASARTAPTWCIFDNTAAGAAVHDAAYLRERLVRRRA